MMKRTTIISKNALQYIIILFLFIIFVTLFDYSHIGNIRREGTKLEYLLCLFIMNIVYITSNNNINKSSTKYTPWFFFLFFCIFGYYDTDYFGLGADYKEGFHDFRDPLYIILSYFSFHSYSLFRIIIWGSSLYLFRLTLKRYDINPNIGIYILSFLYISMFAYPRAILGMTLFFYGYSIIITQKHLNFKHIFTVLVLFFLSFLAHRSMAVLIGFIPFSLIKQNKSTVFILIALLIIIPNLLFSNLTSILNYVGDSSVSETAIQYSNYLYDEEFNLKFKIIVYLKRAGLYIPLIYIVYRQFFKKNINLELPLLKMLNISLLVAFLASAFLILGNYFMGFDIMGYRFLYMIGIPIIIILAKLTQEKKLRIRSLNFLLCFEFLASEGFLIGKILSDNIK